MFGQYFTDRQGRPVPFAGHHREMWRWIWNIRRGERQRAFVAIWPRDGGKSTNAELACATVGARRARKYVLYVSGTQDQADDHVQNVAAVLESPVLGEICPDLTQRALTRYGHSKGWRRNRLRSRSGFTVDALGLNTAARGIKLEMDRPDMIVLDDIDDETDTIKIVEKKIKMLTRKVLPSGSMEDLVVLSVQNLIHPESVFSRLVDGRAQFLSDRVISGPHPAIVDLKYERKEDHTVLTGGKPTWEGLNLARCQDIVDDIGLDAFLSEHQHERRLKEGGIVGDIWNEATHVIEPFEIPAGWHIDRSFDWGSTKPFSVLYFAEADGETPARLKDGTGRLYQKGTLFVIAEIYGWNGKPNQGCRYSNGEIARSVKAKEKDLPWGSRVKPGPADTQIFNVTSGDSIAADMQRVGVRWTEADKGPGSRVNGAQKIRSMLAAALKEKQEQPALYFFNTCEHGIRTLPILARDPVKPDDADSEGEDHWWDGLRYRVLHQRKELRRLQVTGI
ncbi:MAG: hypothetical protein ACRD1R_05740 [Acidobacteriota bacterium]